MVTASIIRFMRVLPVPVTAFNHTTETDINNIPVVTIRNTGTAASTNSFDKRNTDSNSCANTLNNTNMNKAETRLSVIMRFMSLCTSLLRPWPMILLTIALVVDAKAHINTPDKEKIFRITLEIASARSP